MTETQPVFRHKEITLLQGDALDTSLFSQPFIDLIVTSPPYNLGLEYITYDDNLNYFDYLGFSRKWMTNCFNWSKAQARMCLNIPIDINKLFSFKKDVVFDPFAGSGTTLLVVQLLGRNAIGIERESQYFKLASKRIFEETGSLNL